jgi:hypothetical protein
MGGGFFGQVINYFRDGWHRLRRGYGARVKLLDISLTGNTKIPFVITQGVVANFSSPYQTVYSILGNNKIKTKESISLKGNYKKPLLFDSLKTKGKKDFRRLILEFLLDEEDD